MKKLSLLLILAISFSYSQTSDPGVTSTGNASGNHAFVGTHADGVFSNWLETGDSATAYNLLGFTNQHAGFGVADGPNIVSPLIWMYANPKNAFRVRTINFNTDLTSGTDLFTVRADGNVGIGTVNPLDKFHINEGDIRVYGYNTSRYLRFTEDHLQGAFINYDGTRNVLNLGVNNIGSDDTSNDVKAISIVRSTGNVGVGTTAPEEKLEVIGLVKIRPANNEDNNSPGITVASNDDFLYNDRYLNHYGFGFHGYNDGTSSYTAPNNAYVSGYFGIDFFSGGQHRMRISRDGIVSIGTAVRQVGYKLAVNGNIKAKEIKVETGWSDFVFDSDYNLPTLKSVEHHIKEKGHLKDIPSAEDVAKNGVFLGDMDSKLLQKIEELTLYTIDQEKRIENLEAQNKKLMVLLEKLVDKKGE